MTPPVRAWGRVLERRKAAADTFWIEVDCPSIAEHARPGQFVMLGTGLSDVAAPFLPRLIRSPQQLYKRSSVRFC